MAKYTAIGGQALIEGIMMKSPEKSAIAVRTPENEIDITYLEEKSLREKYKFFALPVIRGVVAFVESLKTGYKALEISADKSGFTDLDDGTEPKTEEQKQKDKKTSGAILSAAMVVGAVLGVALAVGLFMLLPRLCVQGLKSLLGSDFSPLVRSLIEQGIKLAAFVLYVYLISLEKDIKRVFMYHGAEHKTIFCYEKGLPLTVENVRPQRRFHPRCGTSFLILMIIVSLVFSTVVQVLFKGVYDNIAVWVIIKILLIPIICGAGFEVLRFTGKYDNALTRIISAPGLWIQRLTTKEPEDGMIEIAIAALRACEPSTPDVDRSIDNAKDDI